MQLSKSLLQAIALGAALSSMPSCSIIEDVVAEPQEQQTEKGTECGSETPDNCPGCGMG